jgi:hypothetical protein
MAKYLSKTVRKRYYKAKNIKYIYQFIHLYRDSQDLKKYEGSITTLVKITERLNTSCGQAMPTRLQKRLVLVRTYTL